MGGNSARTYVRVGDLQEAHRYGLWPWKDVESILGKDACEDATCGYVKYCIKCKVKADTRAFIPQERVQAASVVGGIKRMIELNAQHKRFHAKYRESIQTLLGLRQENTWTRSDVQLL